MNAPNFPQSATLQQDADFDRLDDLLNGFDEIFVEGGTDIAKDDEGCEGGACKI